MLNEDGLAAFSDFLRNARNGGAPRPVPEALLTNAMTSSEIPDAPDLELLPAQITRYELAQYLDERFREVDPKLIEGDRGLGDRGFWGAVALRYFELLTPGFRAGKAPFAENCYIPETRSSMAGLRFFRHRIAGVVRVYKRFGTDSEPLLLTPPGEQSSLYVTITDSVFYTETRCLVEAINLLYFDARNRRLRRGYDAADEPGTLRRLLAVLDQLDLTYDLLGLDGKTLLRQLPEEFDVWKKRQ